VRLKTPKVILLADINDILQWLSVRRSGTHNTKISKIMTIFDGCPNVVRLARACYFRPSSHHDGGLLDDITTDGNPVANFNEDNILEEDFDFDETSGRFSRAGYTPSAERADSENGDDDESTLEVSAKMWKQMQARMSTLENGGGAVSREESVWSLDLRTQRLLFPVKLFVPDEPDLFHQH
jgi:hypothetical protein